MITIITLLFATIMLILTVKDIRSFRQGQHINYKSAIVSLGILGTFIGIFLGLWNFNTENIAISVPQLLEGLKLAFLTSIMGIGLSILLYILQNKAEQPTDEPFIQRLDTINQTLNNLSNQVKRLRTDIYQRRQRFLKLDAAGQALPDETTQWVAIQDNETGLIWETKTNDGGLQDGKHTYTWYHPDSKPITGKENGGHCKGGEL
jgi:hypothetical protein